MDDGPGNEVRGRKRGVKEAAERFTAHTQVVCLVGRQRCFDLP